MVEYDNPTGAPLVNIDAAIAKRLVEELGFEIEEVWDLRRMSAKWAPSIDMPIFPKEDFKWPNLDSDLY